MQKDNKKQTAILIVTFHIHDFALLLVPSLAEFSVRMHFQSRLKHLDALNLIEKARSVVQSIFNQPL